jgi:hypothetical protein
MRSFRKSLGRSGGDALPYSRLIVQRRVVNEFCCFIAVRKMFNPNTNFIVRSLRQRRQVYSQVLAEAKLNVIGATRKHSPQKSLKHPAKESGQI